MMMMTMEIPNAMDKFDKILSPLSFFDRTFNGSIHTWLVSRRAEPSEERGMEKVEEVSGEKDFQMVVAVDGDRDREGMNEGQIDSKPSYPNTLSAAWHSGRNDDT